MPAQDSIGLTGPDYEMDVERGHIRRFARAMGASVEAFTRGYHPVIPATYLVSVPYTWGYSMERPRGTVFADIDHDLTVSLHAEESFHFLGDLPRAGDRFTCRSILEDVKVKSGGRGGDLTFLVMLTEYRNQSGKLVVEQRSTSVTTGQSPSSDDWQVDLPEYDPEYPDSEPVDYFVSVGRECWSQLEVGKGPGKVETGALLLRDIVRFQGVVGEDDALHHDFAWARKFDYPGVFGLGTHQASLLAGYAAHWLDPQAVRYYRARFKSIIWPGDKLSYEGLVVKKYRNEISGKPAVDVQLKCRRENGELLVEVDMTLEFADVDTI
ncbi:MAG: MaoC family dehydratase N-terminal domain-containing protein [Pseudomonadota bacterium]